MTTLSAPARLLAALGAAALSVTSLAGCTLITTIAEAGATTEPTVTETPIIVDGEDGSTTPPPTTPSPTSGEQGQPTDYFHLKVGDCFDEPAVADGTALLYSSCDVPHLYEAYALVVMEGATYPGEQAVLDFGQRACSDAFQGYVGSSLATSKFTYSFIYPTEGTWNNMGDREFLCTVTPHDEVKTTGSAKDSRK